MSCRQQVASQIQHRMASLSSSRSRVFSAYRRLFRARTKLFVGDTQALQESKNAIRQQFLANKAAPTSGEHFEGLLVMAEEAEDMLLHGFVQGKLNDKSQHYEVQIKQEHTGDGDDMANIPQLEPVTEKTIERMENPGVEVTQTCKQSKKD